MAHRALQLVSRGLLPPVPVGELIPDTYVDSLGNEQPVDFERLVDLGAAKPDEGDGYSDLKVGELKQLAEDRGIELEGKPTKATLVEALQAADAQLAAKAEPEAETPADEPDPGAEGTSEPEA